MLRTATQLLLRLPQVGEYARRRLLRLRAILEEVDPIADWRGVRAPTITRLNEHYKPALALAELVLQNLSLDQQTGKLNSATFVFDMNKVFEDFVTAAFTDAMRRYGGAVRPQVGDYSLDEDARLKLRPDIGWWEGNRCLAVVDAKYKAIDDGLLRHDDAYQMLAYCTAYGLDRGYLVYAKDSGAEPRTHLVRNAKQQIVVRAFDVELEPEALLAQVQQFADEVAVTALAAIPA